MSLRKRYGAVTLRHAQEAIERAMQEESHRADGRGSGARHRGRELTELELHTFDLAEAKVAKLLGRQ